MVSDKVLNIAGGINVGIFFVSAILQNAFPSLIPVAVISLFLNLWFCWQMVKKFWMRISSQNKFKTGIDPLYLVSLNTMFEIFGFVAKSDGVVTEKEIDYSLELMSIFITIDGQEDLELKERLKDAFRRGKGLNECFEKVRLLKNSTILNPRLKIGFLYGLINLSYLESNLSEKQKKLIEEIAAILEVISQEELRKIFRSFEGHADEEHKSPVSDHPVEAALIFLGCSSTDSYATLKRRYLELCKKYHPDSIGSVGGSDKEKSEGERQMKNLNRAWGDLSGHLKKLKETV